ncbi:MAG: LEA type 2 family protein [Myxococcales bacterium]
MRTLLRFGLVAATALGCASAPPRPPASPLEPAGLDVAPIDLGSFRLLAKVTVRNDSDVAWMLQSAMAQVTVDGVLSGSDTVTLSQTVPAHQTLAVAVPTSAEPIHDANALRDWAAKGERRIPVVVAGALQLSQGGAIRDLPFSVAGSLEPPALPIVAVSEASLAEAAGARTATFVLSIQNPNAFPVAVHAVTCRASLEGRLVAEGFGQGPAQLPARASARYRWSGLVPAAIASDIDRQMTTGRLAYDLDGTLNLGRIQLPLRFNGPLAAAK